MFAIAITMTVWVGSVVAIWVTIEHHVKRGRQGERVPDVAYRMTLIHQAEVELRAQERVQGRIIPNTDFAEYCMDAQQENPDLTERGVVHMYLDDEPLPSDFLGRNSGQLEEEI